MKAIKAALFVALLVSSVLVAGSFGAAAHTNSTDGSDDGSTNSDADVIEVGRQDVTIRDLTITISDTHVRGTGLPDKSVDEARYTLEESTITTDGFLVTFQDRTYRICAIDVTLDDVGLELHDVSIGEGVADGGTDEGNSCDC